LRPNMMLDHTLRKIYYSYVQGFIMVWDVMLHSLVHVSFMQTIILYLMALSPVLNQLYYPICFHSFKIKIECRSNLQNPKQYYRMLDVFIKKCIHALIFYLYTNNVQKKYKKHCLHLYSPLMNRSQYENP
jgi:hypothetical protein